MEMARMGVPVLATHRGVTPIPTCDFMDWEPTPERYFAKCQELLEAAPSLDRIRFAFRWYQMYTLGPSVDLGDVIPASDYTGLPPFRLSRQASTVEQVIVEGKDIMDVYRERLHGLQHAQIHIEEERALKKEMRRLLWFLFTGKDRQEDYHLRLVRSNHIPDRETGGLPSSPMVEIVQDGSNLVLRNGKHVWNRYSPMASRLASLCAHDAISIDRRLGKAG